MELMILYSHYNLLSPYYSDDSVVEFLRNVANMGGWGFQIFSMLEAGGEMSPDGGIYGEEWNFSPWKKDWSWNDEYFRRLELVLDKAKKYNLRVVYTIYAIQKNPLTPLTPDQKLSKLRDLIQEIENRDLLRRIDVWGLINEGGTGAWKEGETGEEYYMYTRMLAELVRSYMSPQQWIFYSGEMPLRLAPFYDVYSQHNFGENWQKEAERKDYISSLRKIIIPSTDGYRARLDDLMLFLWCKTEGYVGLEIDVGWFMKGDKLDTLDWGIFEVFIKNYRDIYGKYPENYKKYPKPKPKPEPEPEPEPKPKPKPEPRSNPCKYTWYRFNFKRLGLCLGYLFQRIKKRFKK